MEREVLTEVLKQTGGNKARAARLLQADYKTIHTKVKKLGIRVGEELRDIRHGNRSEEETFESELTPEGLGPEIEEHLNCSVIDVLEQRPKQRRLATAA